MESSALSSLGVFQLRPKVRPRDAAFPLGLGESGVHEVCEDAFGHMASLTGFVLAAIRRRRGAVFWISQLRLSLDHGDLLQTGLEAFLRPRPAMLSVHPRKLSDALWAIEEAVRSNAVGLVVAEIEDADFTSSRRLALASSRHGVPVILLMPYTRQGATAAAARWRVKPLASAPNRFDPHAPGHTRWRAVLERSRQAPQMSGQNFNLELNNETLSLTMVSGLAADPLAAREPGVQDRGHTGTIRRFG